jgi:hypothetical protein
MPGAGRDSEAEIARKDRGWSESLLVAYLAANGVIAWWTLA